MSTTIGSDSRIWYTRPMRPTPNTTLIIEALRKNPTGLTVWQIQEATGLDKSYLYKTLRNMHVARWVNKTPTGYTTGPAAPATTVLQSKMEIDYVAPAAEHPAVKGMLRKQNDREFREQVKKIVDPVGLAIYQLVFKWKRGELYPAPDVIEMTEEEQDTASRVAVHFLTGQGE